MNTIKKLFMIVALFLAFIAFAMTAEASYFNDFYDCGGSGWGYNSPYNEFTQANSYKDDHRGSFFDGGYSDRSSDRSYNSFQNDRFRGTSLSGEGYFDSRQGNTFQNGNVGLNDGYNYVDSSPEVVEIIHYNGHGKDNDWTLTRKIKDGITGNSYRDNSYNNAVRSNDGYNTGSLGFGYDNSNTQRNSGFDESLTSASRNTKAYGKQTSYVNTRIGRGTQVFFY